MLLMILRRSAVLLAAAALLTACGTDSSSDTDTTTTTTTAPTTATSTAVETGTPTETTGAADATETVAAGTTVETTTVIPADCAPESFTVGDLGDPVVDFCDGAFAKVSQRNMPYSIVFQSVDGQWDIYPQHGLQDDGEWCYSPTLLTQDGAAEELQEMIPLCEE